jgi:hypothetical protein
MSTSAPRSGPGQPQAVRRRVMSTGTVIFLIAAGAILRFAVAPGSPHGLNVHVVGIVLMLAGVLGLLVSLLARRPLNQRPPRPGRRQESEDPGSTEIKEAAAARVAAVLENDGPQPPPEQPSRA